MHMVHAGSKHTDHRSRVTPNSFHSRYEESTLNMKITRKLLSTLLVASSTLLAGAPAMAATNFVGNGEFCLNCMVTGWALQTSQATFLQVKNDGTGSGFLYVKDAPASISQQFLDTAGPLSLSFDYWLEQSNPDQALSVIYNNQTIFSTTTKTAGWQHMQFAVTGTGLDSLRFNFNTFGVGASTAMLLDNVSVTAVPEPETYGMLLGGLALMGVIARRRRA